MGGWMDGWVEVKAVLRIAYSNQKYEKNVYILKSNTISSSSVTNPRF
jgi:hypothetical protein